MHPDPNPVLALDCSGSFIALALGNADDPVSYFEEMQRGQAEHLIDKITTLLHQHQLSLEALSAIAVGRGPGNFTGLRIAISAARGLAMGLDTPCIGVTRFEVLQHRFGLKGLGVIDAPRGNAYVQDLSGNMRAELWSADQLARAQQSGALLWREDQPQSLANDILAVAEKRLGTGDHGPAPSPLYIKPADAAPAAPGPLLLRR